MSRAIGTVVALLLCAGTSAGCAAAAAAGAAGTGIYLTTRGAEGTVSVGIQEAAATTEEVFDDLGIRHAGERWVKEDAELEIYGRLENDDEVTVDLERVSSGLTEVEVRVRESVASWDKETARTILEEIRDRAD